MFCYSLHNTIAKMNSNSKETKMIQNAYYQFKELLELYREFYPFALGINNNSEIYNINTYSGNEYPEIPEHLEELKKAVSISIKDNKLCAVCFCVNVRIKPPYDILKLDAIEIQINNSIGDAVNYYIPYEILEQTIEFYELFELQGTLRFW